MADETMPTESESPAVIISYGGETVSFATRKEAEEWLRSRFTMKQ